MFPMGQDNSLRTDLEPNMDEAARLYPMVLARMNKMMREIDEHGDAGPPSVRAADDIEGLTTKIVEPIDLVYAWEGEGEEVVAFRISFPDPPVVEDISLSELTALVHRVAAPPILDSDSFSASFGPYLDRWYAELLRRNFRRYRPEMFNRRRNSAGDWNEPSVADIAAAIWDE